MARGELNKFRVQRVNLQFHFLIQTEFIYTTYKILRSPGVVIAACVRVLMPHRQRLQVSIFNSGAAKQEKIPRLH